MIVARPHQEGSLKFRLEPSSSIKVKLYTSPNAITPKVNIFHPIVDPSDVYDGDYVVKPIPYNSQELETQDKFMYDNVTVLPIPYFETSNLSDGLTVYIGE